MCCMAEEEARNRKKIVLVNITRPFRGAELELHAPLALMYLSQALKDVGFDTVEENACSCGISRNTRR